MELLAQFAEHERRRNDNQPLELSLMRMTIKGVGDFLGKAFLGDLVPVRIIHGAAPKARSAGKTSGPVSALISGGGVGVVQLVDNAELDVTSYRVCCAGKVLFRRLRPKPKCDGST